MPNSTTRTTRMMSDDHGVERLAYRRPHRGTVRSRRAMVRVPPLRVPPIGFAHRGARAHAPENTLEAFRSALASAPPASRATPGSPPTARWCSTTTAWSAGGCAGGRSPSIDRADLPEHIPTLEELYADLRHRLRAVARREGPGRRRPASSPWPGPPAAARRSGSGSATTTGELVATWRRALPRRAPRRLHPAARA